MRERESEREGERERWREREREINPQLPCERRNMGLWGFGKPDQDCAKGQPCTVKRSGRIVPLQNDRHS